MSAHSEEKRQIAGKKLARRKYKTDEEAKAAKQRQTTQSARQNGYKWQKAYKQKTNNIHRRVCDARKRAALKRKQLIEAHRDEKETGDDSEADSKLAATKATVEHNMAIIALKKLEAEINSLVNSSERPPPPCPT